MAFLIGNCSATKYSIALDDVNHEYIPCFTVKNKDKCYYDFRARRLVYGITLKKLFISKTVEIFLPKECLRQTFAI